MVKTPRTIIINHLYSVYIQTPDEASLEALFSDVLKYVTKILFDISHKKGWRFSTPDVAQDATLKVFLNLGKFDAGKSKFSTWVYTIARNTLTDELRKVGRTQEVSLNTDVAVDAPYSGRSAGKLETDELDGGAEGAALISQEYIEMSERDNVSRLALKEAKESMSSLERIILDLLYEGYTPIEIGEHFGRNAKWASNQITRLRKRLKVAMDKKKDSGQANHPISIVEGLKEPSFQRLRAA
jgi:RNA polymerase sigma factor (sigma-70 family)